MLKAGKSWPVALCLRAVAIFGIGLERRLVFVFP